MNVFSDVRRHACEEHRVELIDVDAVRDRRCRNDATKRVPNRTHVKWGAYRRLACRLRDDGANEPRVDRAGNEGSLHAGDFVKTGQAMVAPHDVLKRRLDVVAAFLVGHVEQGDPIEVNDGSDLIVACAVVEQYLAVPFLEYVIG